MNTKTLAAALFLFLAAAAAGFSFDSFLLAAVGVAAALISLGFYFYFKNVKKMRYEEIKQQEINQKIQQVNFPAFMNKVKQKYGEIILKYRLPPNPVMLERYQYWCCDDYLIILPEWNYYQELVYKKYKDSYIFEQDEKKLLDDMFVVNKRDILCFEKSRDYNRSYISNQKNKKYERTTPAYTAKNTCISYRKNGLIAEKVLPEAAYEILLQLIPEKQKQ